MSFANDVRTEILDNLTLRKQFRSAQGYGLLLCSKHFDAGEISMTTERREIARLYRSTLLDLLGPGQEITIEQTGMGNATRHFSVTLHGAEAGPGCCGTFPSRGTGSPGRFWPGRGRLPPLSAGPIWPAARSPTRRKTICWNSPSTGRGWWSRWARLLEQTVGAPKFVLRRDTGVLYYRESENIEDALTAAGAPKSWPWS